MANKTALTFFTFFLVFVIKSNALNVHGSVKDTHGMPIPFANVFLINSTTGTSTNANGLYNLKLNAGNYTLVFRMMSYKQVTKTITLVTDDVELNVTLADELYSLNELVINANGEDPAYAIIRKAQSRRKHFEKEVTEFSCNAYIKSTQRLTTFPKKFMGQSVELGSEIDTVTGIFYLSESVSKLNVGGADKIKEEMISSKVSGKPQTYSFNTAASLLFSFYNNNINLGNITSRGLISPIAGNALFYYTYLLEGTFYENGSMINKIKVIPKRSNDPVFTGTLFIVDDSWRIHAADLFFTKAQSIEFVDTFRMKQTWVPVTDSIWMPFSNQYNYSFSFLVFKGNGIVLGINSDYNINPEFSKNYFNAEIIKVNNQANKKDSTYWNTFRPVPLLNDEILDYVKKDSIRIIEESKPFLDSIDAKKNKLKFNNFINGYYHNNSFEHRYWNITSPVKQIQFNTVQGYNLTLSANYLQAFGENDKRSWSLNQKFNYGFGDQSLNSVLKFDWYFNAFHDSRLIVEGGVDKVQYNENMPITPWVNTLYSLIAEKNYMKLYEKKFIHIKIEREITNGIKINASSGYAHRNMLQNSSHYVLFNIKERTYSVNNPLYPIHTPSLQNSKILFADVHVSFKIKQEYISRPEAKYNFDSKYPTFKLHYRKAIKAFDANTKFDLVEFTLLDDIKLGLLGTLKYNFKAGSFIQNKNIFFVDAHHFNGNKTWVSDFGLSNFRLMEYYAYSTFINYIEIHAEQNFGGFLFNKIPIFRKLKLQEIVGLHYANSNTIKNYTEFTFGIEKLQILRVEYAIHILPDGKLKSGFLFGLRKQIR